MNSRMFDVKLLHKLSSFFVYNFQHDMVILLFTCIHLIVLPIAINYANRARIRTLSHVELLSFSFRPFLGLQQVVKTKPQVTQFITP